MMVVICLLIYAGGIVGCLLPAWIAGWWANRRRWRCRR